MVSSLPAPQAATALPDVEQVVQRLATCPLCHTTDLSLSDDGFAAGEGWRCIRCGQRWDSRRLATVAAHAASALDRRTATARGQVTASSDHTRGAEAFVRGENRGVREQ